MDRKALQELQEGDVYPISIQRDASHRHYVVDSLAAAPGFFGTVEVGVLSYQVNYDAQDFKLEAREGAQLTFGSPITRAEPNIVHLATLRFMPEAAVDAARVLLLQASRQGVPAEKIKEALAKVLGASAEK